MLGRARKCESTWTSQLMTEIMLEQFPPCHTAASGELHYFLIDLVDEISLLHVVFSRVSDQLGNSVGMHQRLLHLAPENRGQLLHSAPDPAWKDLSRAKSQALICFLHLGRRFRTQRTRDICQSRHRAREGIVSPSRWAAASGSSCSGGVWNAGRYHHSGSFGVSLNRNIDERA